MPAPVVHIERFIAAPPEKVFRAWLDPDLICRWMSPGSIKAVKAEVDERAGGHYRVWQEQDGVPGGGFDADILEIVPDRKLVFGWRFVGPERMEAPAYESLLTISLEEAPGGTDLTLDHEKLDELYAAMPDVADMVETGWNMVLDLLPAAIAAG